MGSPPDLVGMLVHTAARRGTHTAVEGPDAILSFAALDRLSNQLANRLISLGVTRDTCVCISLHRGAVELVAMLATLKAGGAYVPLDPTHPSDRLELVVEDARPKVILVHPGSPFAKAAASVSMSTTVLILDDLARVGTDPTPPELTHDPKQLAYVLFTSGSTGRPKGVEISREAFANFLRSMSHTPGLTEEDRLLAVTTTSFDIAGLELFLPLWVGATVVIVNRETALDPRLLSEVVEHRSITILQATPTSWRLWLKGGWRGTPRLRLLCGGEPLTSELAKQLLNCGRELWNMYGPTETTVWSALELITSGTDAITIGGPIDETQLYILDEKQGLVPRGTTGELYIGGLGVARGYRGSSELTANRFIKKDPRGRDGDRIFRTGDLARQREDGRFECLGRIDEQVKISGVRIELGEIDAILRQAPGVGDGVAAAWQKPGKETSLVGYIVPKMGTAADVLEIRRFVQSRLPLSMVPTTYVLLDTLPLNTNRKIDRRALPPPTDEAIVRPSTIVPPRNARERRLVEMWSSLLEMSPIGISDNFFDLGGSSLQTVFMMIEIEAEFGVKIPVSALLEHPTIEKLSALLVPEAAQHSSIVTLREGGEQLPMFFIHDGLGEVMPYRILARHLAPGGPVYGVRPHRARGSLMAHTRIVDMANYYADEILRIQPKGPYYIGALSTGGLIVLEIARKLQAKGQLLRMVALFDTAHVSAHPKDRFQERLRGLWVPKAVNKASFSAHLLATIGRGAKKLGGFLEYQTRRMMEAVRDSFKVKLLRYCLAREASLPEIARNIPMRIVLEIAEKEYTGSEPYRGEVVLFRATRKDSALDNMFVDDTDIPVDDTPYVERFIEPHLGWHDHVTNLVICDVPGGHVSALMEPHVRTLAASIQAYLDGGRTGSSDDSGPGPR
jgi:amino acid adenylation domain-containing protein